MINAKQDISDRLIWLFCGFIIIQPLLDYYFLFEESIKTYTLLAPPTIIRFALIGVMFGYIWFSNIRNDRLIRRVTAYFGVLALYSILHIVICINFPVVLPPHYRYEVIDEVFYLIRIMLPLMLLIVTWKMPLDSQHIRTVTISIAYIIGVTMILSNLLGFSLIAYQDTPVVSDQSFLVWFTGDIGHYVDATSKGVFYKANQISGVLVLLFPVNLMLFLKKPTVVSFFAGIMLILCMFMLGTRVSTYGAAIVLAAIPVIYIAHCLIKKQPLLSWKSALLLLFVFAFVVIYPFSPYAVRSISNQLTYEKGMQINSEMDSKDDNEPIATSELEYRLNMIYMPSYFHRTGYPVAEDYEFWKKVSSMPYNKINDNRKQQVLITQRIHSRIEENKAVYDLFGMGRSRFANGNLLIELDFSLQRYTLGWVGVVLFFGPMIILVLLCSLKLLCHFKVHFNIENATILLSVWLFFITSVFSGHLLDELFPISICVFFLGYLSRQLFSVKTPL